MAHIENRRKVLFVDDEKFFARPYIERLETRYEVDFCESVEGAYRRIKANREYAVLVLDLMMPPPDELMTEQIVAFVDTGLWLLEQCYDEIVLGGFPTIILTNREFPTFRERFEAIGFPEDLVEIRPKYDTSSLKLLERVALMESRWKAENLDRPY